MTWLWLCAGLLIGASAAWLLLRPKGAAPSPADHHEPDFVPPSPRAAALLADATSHAEQQAASILLAVMQRSAARYVPEASMSVVTLPTEDIKGRIIGREGRNIRSFEQVTGCDLLLEESSAVISSFDPIRRQAARLTLEKLIQDGRIHPARIEETHPISLEEVEKRSRAAGEDASRRAGVAGLKPAVLGKLGALEFKASLGQNVLEHSVEVAQFAGLLAGELGLNQEVARRAGLLHDIGKALPGDEPHALAGMRFLAGHGETEPVLNAVGAHHRELDCASPEAEVVILADMLSGSRPGARRSDLQAHIERLTGLEEIAQRQPGVREAYAIRAGKELRVIVEPEAVDDVQAAILAAEIAAQIDESGCVVTVIREVRRKAVSQRPSNGC